MGRCSARRAFVIWPSAIRPECFQVASELHEGRACRHRGAAERLSTGLPGCFLPAQPHRTGTFKLSTDPELEAKIRDVVGLYLSRPDNAVVVSVDEKSQIQALDRAAPMLPLQAGLAERRTRDCKRKGTAMLFAALEAATGKITADACRTRHRPQEFPRFVKQVAAAHPGVELHVVLDRCSTRKHPEVRRWLAELASQRITLHFTLTGCSWLTMVEIFVGIITRQAIRCSTFRSVKDLTSATGRFTSACNQRCQPFTWTSDAGLILAKASRPGLRTPSGSGSPAGAT